MSKLSRADAFDYALELTKILAAKSTENTNLDGGNAKYVAEFISVLTDKLSQIEID